MSIQQSKQQVSWKLAPFLRLLFPLIAGILLEKKFPVHIDFLIPAFCLSFLLTIFCHTISFSRSFGLGWITGLAIQIVFCSFGRILTHIHKDIPIEHSACFSKHQPNCLVLEILSTPVSKKNSFKCIARVNWLIKGQASYYENEKVIVYFSKKSDPRQISVGDWIVIKKDLQAIENFKTADFDYTKYCHLRHLYAQVFLKENEFVLIQQEHKKSISTLLDSLRKKLLLIIKNQIPFKSESSLLEALMVGFTDDLDPGLLKSYADTGVIHIIAISGLHLALICHILQFSLKRVGKNKSAQWIKLFVIMITLWAYSFLSGASPSVIRAAAMFSLVLLARNITREAVLYNTLAASAFLLICFDPNWIWDIGFQLSYAAVLSLCLFAKPVREILHVQNKILVLVWNAVSVSIAAQMLTTPISIFYFHRFPSYFLIANLLAVPLSSVILLGGILLCIFNWIQPLGHLLGWLLGLMIRFLNGFIHHIAQLPGAVIPELTCSVLQLVLVYFIIFCFYRYLKGEEKTWLLNGLGAICLLEFTRLIP